MDSLPPNTVQWDHPPVAIHAQDDGTFELAFRHGRTETVDLVVGADGAGSCVRPLVSEARPVYSGVTFLELGIDDVDTRFPELASLIGRGLTFAVGDSKALIGHRDANAHITVYAAMRVPEDWIEKGGLDLSSADAKRASIAAHFAGWSENLLELIYRSGDRITPRTIQALPVGHRWEHRPGVTLLGDAAHLMSPFGGNGANLAMLDAADLALALTQTEDWRAALQAYKVAMLARAEEAAAAASDAVNSVFSEDGLAHTLQAMESQRG
ncbi:NAD(P)/FAD-dependent oxidoreductase [Burkholderia sp. S171]|uniref:FAD-dependent oxidoreductase n=1 Tax=Burkholderia sp. S171 TaxID=1641860 RepID=UPI00131D9FD5|nr:FAD-dependent monooxygenase [Burkholderia sp. S171]